VLEGGLKRRANTMQLSVKPNKEEFFTLNLAQNFIEEEFNSDDLFELDFTTNHSHDDEEIGDGLDPSRKI
jgi:hypothetical protein